MRTKDESHQNQHRHSQKEHAQWLEKLHKWRAQHRHALAKLAKLRASLMEHDAELEEHLSHVHLHEQHIERHERDIAERKTNGKQQADEELTDGHSELDRRHRDIRARIKRMEDVHTETMETLDRAIDELRDVHERLHPDVEHAGPDPDDKVQEASEESFPASDPPSYYPDRP